LLERVLGIRELRTQATNQKLGFAFASCRAVTRRPTTTTTSSASHHTHTHTHLSPTFATVWFRAGRDRRTRYGRHPIEKRTPPSRRKFRADRRLDRALRNRLVGH
jgi:hypothetical protein